MQQSWRKDSDKLTFITCTPQTEETWTKVEHIDTIIGDVNLFICINEEEDGNLSLAGEIEVMVAEKHNQRRGLGCASILAFLKYVLSHQQEILQEFFQQPRSLPSDTKLSYFRAKIGESNMRSINLFESLGFAKTDKSPNFFNEWELRTSSPSIGDVDKLMEQHHINGYTESSYPDSNDTIPGPDPVPSKEASSVDGKGVFDVPLHAS